MIKCSVCGEMINEEFKFCPNCGAVTNQNLIKQNSHQKNKAAKKIINKEADKKLTAKNEIKKNLSSTNLFYLILILLISGLGIIYSSGIFDYNVNVTQSQNSNINNPHSGVDLASLEQINALEESVKKNPKDKQSLLNLSHLLNDSGFKDKAIDRYNQYLKLDPVNADVLVDLGVCYFETGKNTEALKSMEKALQIQPKHQIAHLNLGIVNMTVGNSDKAIEFWKKAIEINPSNEIGKKAAELIKTH